MALATQCPYCQTRFRVASDQLKLRGGIVRCGACQRIFDGSAHLIDLDAARPAALAETPLPQASEPEMSTPETPVAEAPAPETPALVAEAAQADAADAMDAAAVAAPHDPEAPHGDPLALALDDASPVEVDVDLPPLEDDAAEVEVEVEVELPPPQPQPNDPEAPHEDAPAHAVDAPSAAPAPGPVPAPVPAPVPDRIEPALPPLVSFTPPGRIEPSFDLPVDEAFVAQPLHDADDSDSDSDSDNDNDNDNVSDAAPPAAAALYTALKPAPEHAAPASSPPDSPLGAPPAAPAGSDTPPPALPLRASAGAGPHDPSAPPHSAAPLRSARARALDARTRRTKLTPTRIDAPRLRVPETDEPEFVKRSRKQEQSGRTRRLLLAAGTMFLLLVLAAQLVLSLRTVLAARYPGTRPVLGAACALLGCRVDLPTQIDNLAIENGELTTLGPDTYALTTLLRNQGSLVQAWPSIELELTDANDKPVLRRVFAPGEYLAPGSAAAQAAAGLGARSEQPVKLHFALADLKPSGYHIFIFYP